MILRIAAKEFDVPQEVLSAGDRLLLTVEQRYVRLSDKDGKMLHVKQLSAEILAVDVADAERRRTRRVWAVSDNVPPIPEWSPAPTWAPGSSRWHRLGRWLGI